MIVNRVACDWLTFSTSVYEAWQRASAEAFGLHLSMGRVVTAANWRDYRGKKIGDLFSGSRVRAGQKDYILIAMGTDAADCIRQFKGKHVEGKFTRVDLQVTVKEPEGYKPLETVMRMQELGINAHPLGSSTGYTIAIGNRSSDRYWRIYQKSGEDNDKWLRFEIELSGDLARAFKVRFGNGESYRGMYNAEFAKLISKWSLMPAPFDLAVDDVLKVCGHHSGSVLVPMDVPDSNRMRWLRGQVSSAIHKAHNDHDTHAAVRDWIAQLVREMGGGVVWIDRYLDNHRQNH